MTVSPTIRRARLGDLPLLQEMFASCSARTGYQRFHSPVRVLPRGYVADCVDPLNLRQLAFVAEVTEQGVRRVVALGSAAAVPWTRGVREVGVLVEDAWQHRGIGDTLVRALFLDALRMGDHTITVEACTSANPWMPDHLRRAARVTSVSRSGCDVCIETDIAETVRLYACSHWAA